MATEYSPQVVTNGLVLYLDAANPRSYVSGSTNWFNLADTSISGSLTNGPTFNTGSLGTIVLDGVDDYVNISHNSSFNFGTGPFTISLIISSNQLKSFTAYIKKGGPNEWGNSPAGWYATSGNGTTDQSWYWVFADGVQHTELAPFSTFSKSNDTFPLNFFTISRDSNGSFARSWNGAYETIPVIPIVNTSTWSASFDNSSDIWIGRGRSNYLNGSVAICRLYNRALTQTEVQQNFNALRGRYGI